MSKPKDICFLSGLFPREFEKDILYNSICSVDNAANALQWNILEGIELNNKEPINVINSMYIGSYPKRYKKAIIKTKPFRNNVKSLNVNVGFINIFGIKHYGRYLSIKKYLKKWAKVKNDEKIIISYALTLPFIKALKYVKKICPNIKTCMVVPDLPEYMNTSKNNSKLYKILKGIEINVIKNNLKYVDGFILLTEHMSDALNIDKYVVIEGVATNIFKDFDENEDIIEKQERIILYTGTLNEKYGILNLIQAFKAIDNKDYKLIICGHGDSIDEILKSQKEDCRIEFKGLLPRHEVLKLQMEADVLINPRQNIEEFTKYSFPSKNLEYLSSGTPLIAYKLDGIPDEYDEYIYYVEDNTINALKEKILDVCSKSNKDLKQFGLKGKNFVLKNKNNLVQTKKIYELFGD